MRYTTITFLAVIASFAISYSVEGGDEFKCLGKTMHYTDAQKETLKTCHTEWEGRHPDANATTDTPWLESCFWACNFIKLGWVKDRKFNIETAKTDVVAMVADIPSEDQDKIKTAFNNCSANTNQTDTLSTDDHCESFINIGICILQAVYWNCKKDEQQQ